MNDFLANIFIFCIVLVLYLHVYRHTKQSNDLEVYEIESHERLEEVLDCLQPTLFDLDLNEPTLTRKSMTKLYHAFEINIRDNADIQNNTLVELYLPFVLKDANNLFQSDVSKNYFSENNQDFLQETGLIKLFRKYDEILRPQMNCNTLYDLIIGTKDVKTPLRYHLHFRHFITVTEGKIKIRITPPKSSKFLNPIYDYENFEFRSLKDLWNAKEEESHKIKCMEIELAQGKMISIPPYWWYTIKLETQNTAVATFSYRTYMNYVSISPQLFISILQKNNIKEIVSKTFEQPITQDSN
jgi:hypothetical protein